MNEEDSTIFIERMTNHLDQYLLFYTLCRSKDHIDEKEIPMLWTTWSNVAKWSY